MKIQIDEKAKAYLNQKGKRIITLSLRMAGGG